ncbi:MAG: DedA family protein, partial [Mesorhizobium sp.]
FSTIGYVFGLGAEQLIGQALMRHERLFVGLGIGLAVAVLAWLAARHIAKRERAKEV